MKNRLIFFIVILSLIINILPISAFAEQQDDIIILYENDVHCEIEGYSAISALRNELKQEYEHVVRRITLRRTSATFAPVTMVHVRKADSIKCRI